MSCPRPEKRGKELAFWAVVAMSALAVLYPMSMGQAWWMCSQYDETGVVSSAAEAAYAPVIWLVQEHGTSPLLRPFMLWLEWWT